MCHFCSFPGLRAGKPGSVVASDHKVGPRGLCMDRSSPGSLLPISSVLPLLPLPFPQHSHLFLGLIRQQNISNKLLDLNSLFI